MTRTMEQVNRGLGFLNVGKFKAAIKCFEKALRQTDGSNLQKDVAAFYLVNTAKYRREWKKRIYGNAHLYTYNEIANAGNAWSDVDIAAVLVAPEGKKMLGFLSKFLGRNANAIKFQRRYAYGQPLRSWVGESGRRYTRFTQNQNVKNRLGV